MRPKNYLPLMLLFPLLWAGSFIAGKWAVRDFSPEMSTLLRFLMVSAVLFPFAFRKPSPPGTWKAKNLAWVFLLGLTGMFGYHILFYYSLKWTSAGNSSLIISTDTLITVFLAVLFLKERMTWRKGIGILLGFAGVVWVVSDGAIGRLLAAGPNRGDLMAMAAALCWGVYSVLSKKVTHLYNSFDLSWLTYAVGAALLLPWLTAPGSLASLASATLRGWASIAYMALIATGIGYYIYIWGITKVGAVTTAKFIFLVPVFVLGLANIFLGEPVPLYKLAAAAVIIAGLWIAEEPEPSK